MRLRSRAAILSPLLLLAAACTSEPDLPKLRHVDVPSPTAAPTEAAASPQPDGPEPTTPSSLDGLGGRLAVLDEGGNLVTMDPDGSHEIVLAEVEPGQSQVRQPAWSRDGSRLAWVDAHVTEAGTLAVGVATSTAEGKKATESRTLVTPFYLSWDPTSSRIAYLGSPGGGVIELGILEVAGQSSGTPLDMGQPFYLSWGPNGDELLVHVGTKRLDTLDLEGKPTTVARPGAFNTPVWTADGRSFVYASAEAGHQQLVVQDADAGKGRTVMPFEGLITFVVSPDGKQIAFQAFEGGDAFPLTVVDVASGQTT